MAPSTRKSALLLLALGLAGLGAASQDSQVVFSHNTNTHHKVDPAILAALKEHKDPVDAWIALHPEEADKLAEKRLLRIAGEKEPQWMTEGDKMRLRRKGRKFADITDYEEFYKQNALSTQSGKARKKNLLPIFFSFSEFVLMKLRLTRPDLPKLSQQRLVKPLFPQVSKDNMEHVLKHMTSFYTRYFGSVTGEQSALWLRDHIADVRLATHRMLHWLIGPIDHQGGPLSYSHLTRCFPSRISAALHHCSLRAQGRQLFCARHYPRRSPGLNELPLPAPARPRCR